MSGRDRQTGATEARRRVCALRLGITVPLGLVWRLAPLHLPPFAFKYGGSVLWAVAVYWVVAMIDPAGRPTRLGGRAAVVATAVELGKLVHWAALDRFRETLAGKLLLGRYFTVGALVAYGVAIAAMVSLDSRLRPGLGSTRGPRAGEGTLPQRSGSLTPLRKGRSAAGR